MAQRSIADLERQLAAIATTVERQGSATDAQLAAQQRITKELQRQQSLLEESLNTNKEIDDTLSSIASNWGKGSKIYKKTQAQLGVIEGQVENISDWSKKFVGLNKKNKEQIVGAAKSYKNVNAQVLKGVSLMADGKEYHEDIYELLQDQIKKHKEISASIATTNQQGKNLKATIDEETASMEKLAQAAKGAEKDIYAMSKAGQMFAGTMVGAGIDKTLKAFGKKDGLGGVMKSLTEKRGTANDAGGFGGGFTKMLGGVARFLGPIGLAVGAIMLAAEFFDSGNAAKQMMRVAALQGKDPMKESQKSFKMSKQYRDILVEQNYGLPLKLKQQAEQDYLGFSQSVAEDGAKYNESLISDEIDFRMSLETDAIQFRQQQASAELDANLSRQKTLFTTGMGYMKNAIGIGERALQAIGSSTQSVLETVKAYGYSLGIALKDQIALGAAAAGLGARYMASGEEVFKMADTFRLMNKTSAKVGANLVAGLEVLAKQNDMEPAQLFKAMAEAQGDILKYSNYTTEQFARQEILLGQMNLSMSSMMKASDSMVLNYKDSIKAEMSLSSMLGKNVNLSEVRAKLMAGDQAGGAAALKTALGGVDINQMNAFQKQALSQATGMDLQSLMQLQQSGKPAGVKGSLEERNALKTGKAIAQGALSQEIAGQAAKLAMDQKNRAEMLKFEQAKRLAMLFIEQKFRLSGIEREFKYREAREKLSATQSVDTAQMELFKEMASEQVMQATSVYKNTFGAGKFDQAKVDAFKSQISSQMGQVGQAIMSGQIPMSELANVTVAMQKAAMKGSLIDVSKFIGGGSTIDTKLNKPSISTTLGLNKTTSTKTGGMGSEAYTPTILSDTQAQTKLQTKMVELLGASTTILQYILVKENPTIQIDKMRLSKTLLNVAQTQFAIAGVPK